MNLTSLILTVPARAALILRIGVPGGCISGRSDTPFLNSPIAEPNDTHSQDPGISSGIRSLGIVSTLRAAFLYSRIWRRILTGREVFCLARQSPVNFPEHAAARTDRRNRFRTFAAASNRCCDARTRTS